MPRVFAITPDGKIIYVRGDAGTVTPIRAATSTPLEAITLKAGLAATVIAREKPGCLGRPCG